METHPSLSRTPRRRDFKTVPMILNDPDQWDHAALSAVIAYRGAPKQVWERCSDAASSSSPVTTRYGNLQRR